jgi:putative phosphoesterase
LTGSAKKTGPVLLVGVVSDTHDHLYPEVKKLLSGVDHIIHAGDVCNPHLLTELRGIAPLTVVRGNCDMGQWADSLPPRAQVELGGLQILAGHVGGRLREDVTRMATEAGRIDVVIFGHSHQALVERKDGVLYLNPGSAGPRRYGRPRTMAFLKIEPAPADDGDGSAQVSADIVVVDG